MLLPPLYCTIMSLIISPHNLADSRMTLDLVLLGKAVDPRASLRPFKHKQYPALEKVPTTCEKPNSTGTSGHGAFSSLGGKRPNNFRNVNGCSSLANSNASTGSYKTASDGEICRSLPLKREFVAVGLNVTDCAAEPSLSAQLSSCFSKLALS